MSRVYSDLVPRRAHLVGSIPARDAADAMGLALDRLGPHLRYLPDGETGPRYSWVKSIVEDLRGHPDLELCRDGDWSDYDRIPRFKVRRGRRLRAETLDFGHVAAFEANFPRFLELNAGRERPLTFLVGIPGDFDMALFTLGLVRAVRARRHFTAATVREIEAIHRQGGDDVLFQIEVPAEMVIVARAPRVLRRMVAAILGRGIARLAARAPARARFGVHLCLGDMNHRPLGRMRDAWPLVLLANAIVSAWPANRPLEYMHVPLAAAAEPPSLSGSFYAPLSRLRLPTGVRLIAGFAHEEQPLEDQRRLRAVIDAAAGAPVDVACSCGLGRRTREQALAAMERTAQLVT